MQRESFDIIKRPILTEKSTGAISENHYTFEVVRDANKIEIAKAVEEIFKVKVTGVRTMNMTGKARRVRFKMSKKPDWKKAIVTLAEGHQINIM